MSTSLTALERAALRGRAHALEPVVQVGQSGLTDAVMGEIDRALTAHELIKVKLGTDRHARADAARTICAGTGAAAVQQVGRILVLWRPRDEAVEPEPSQSKRVSGPEE